jgi:ketosteroid isomerase-like protein
MLKKKESPTIEARLEVINAEKAFAKSMADRDINAFAFWLSEEAIFFTTSPPLRGKEAIIAWWSRHFSSKEAPFSWDPDLVEILSSRTLALSSGPVHDPAGTVIAFFNSVWRLEGPSRWRVVFDKGSPVPVLSKPLQ